MCTGNIGVKEIVSADGQMDVVRQGVLEGKIKISVFVV
jgi:hypothetical protein